jgi:pSer/pThr/pTyr-binding forkhead associated (FHA) protein
MWRRRFIPLTLLLFGLLAANIPTNASQLSQPVSGPDSAELYAERAVVLWQPAGSDSLQEVPSSQRQEVHSGDAVVTDGLGRARLLLADDVSMAVYHDSHLIIESIDVPTYHLTLEEGTLFLTLEAPDAQIVVETPNAGVEATGQILVHHNVLREATWVVVKDGQAVVRAAGSEVTVTTRQQTWVERASAPVAPQPARRDVVGDRFYLVDDLTNGVLSDSDLLGPGAVSSWLVLIAVLIPFLVAAMIGGLALGRRRRPPRMPAGIRVMLADGAGEFIPLRANLLTIGRTPDNHLALPDSQVSHHHARITRQPEGFVIYDLDSTNGTFVNGQRVTRQLLRGGDDIQIGQTRLIFQVPGVAPSPPERAPRRPLPARAGLRLVLADGPGEFIPLRVDPLTIGRTSDNDLALPDSLVSRHHARITQQAEGFIIEDLDSTNGSLVNGQRVTRQLLRGGDEIQIGQTRLIFEVHPVQEVTA